jgi:hypothetical protein
VKSSVLLGLGLWVGLSAMGPPLGSQTTGQGVSPDNPTSKQNPPIQQQTVTVNCTSGHDNHEKSAVSPEPRHDYAAWGFWFNLCLTPITLLVAGAAVWQAIAAKLSADAVMRSERAWLLLNGEDIGKPVLIPYDSLDNPPRLPAYCMVSLRNCGKTPAFAIDWEFELLIGPSQEAPPSLEIYEKEPPAERPMPFPVGPGWPGHAEARLKPGWFISSAELNEIKTGGKFLWLCGVARYEDVFKRARILKRKAERHETLVCLRYETRTNAPDGYWVLGGPRKYNNAT